MTDHVDTQLHALLLGELDLAEKTRVLMHVRSCGACRAELDALEEAFAAVALDAAPVAAPDGVRDRLLESATRAEGLIEVLAREFDLQREVSAALVEEMKRRTSPAWRQSDLPGLELFDFEGGPRMAGADCGLVWFPGGMQVPLHKHLGRERMFVLTGGLTFDNGRRLEVGGAHDMEAGSQHAFVIDPEGCMSVVSLETGIEIDGHPVKLGPP